jgi:hypothetical protein
MLIRACGSVPLYNLSDYGAYPLNLWNRGRPHPNGI